MRKLFRKVSLKYVYILSFFGVALTACSVIGLILYFSSTHELMRANERQMTESLESFTNYLDTQKKVLEDVVNDIAIKIYFKKFYFERNAYYEVELLKEFSKYKNNSMIVDDYFLLYREKDWVFRSTEHKYDFKVLMDVYGFTDKAEGLYSVFNSLQEFTVIPCRDSGKVLLAFPVSTSGKNNKSGLATVAFLVSAERLHERLEALVGEVKGNVYLFQNDDYLMNINLLDSSYEEHIPTIPNFKGQTVYKKNNTTYFISNSKGAVFNLMLHMPPGFAFENLEHFSYINVVYIFISTLILLILSICVGYYNYLPIKRLMSKYLGLNLKNKDENELRIVEFFLDRILKEKEKAETGLEEQYRIIKQQILSLVLDGNERYIQLVSKPFMGIHLGGPVFYIIVIHFNENLNNAAEKRIQEQVESMAGNGMDLYYVNTQYENYCGVIISATDKDFYENAVEHIQIFLHDNYQCRISISMPFYKLQRVQDYFITEVKLQNLEKKINDLARNSRLDSYELYVTELDRVLSNVKSGNYKGASYLFKLMVEKIKKHPDYLIFEQFAFYYAIYKVVTIAKRQEIHMEAGLLKPLSESWDRLSMTVQFDRLIHYICKSIAREKHYDKTLLNRNKKGEYADNLLSFINDNFHDPDMSLDLLSSKYKLSTRYISNIIKDGTGLSYKEYLTNLRIQKAQELLLTQDMTVTDVCESVGYIHLSHFIKTFKSVTGFTPSRLQLAGYASADEQAIRKN